MPTPRQQAQADQRNYQAAVDTVNLWASVQTPPVQPWAHMRRLVFAMVTGSPGLVFAVDATAKQVQDACWLFLDPVRVTANRAYGGQDFDPIIADTLRVFQPATIPATYTPSALAKANDIVDHWGPTYFTAGFPPLTYDFLWTKDSEGNADWTPVNTAVPPATTVGGARTSRGEIDARDLDGATLADKLRKAWGAGDTRDIRAQHGDVLAVGSSPIPIRPGNSLIIASSPQTEFSDSGRLYCTGSTAVFDVTGDMKGARLTNIGFEGQPNLRLFAPEPTNASADKTAYPIITGCSADSFYSIIEAPTLGPTIDFRYINNIYGPWAFKLAGSDGTWFPMGCKIDWGQGNSVAGRTALIYCTYLEKSSFGPFYMTCEGSTGLLIEGSDDRTGLTFTGATIEGRNAAEMSVGALVRQRGAVAAFIGCNFNYGQGSGKDKGYLDSDGGYMSLTACTFKRGSSDQSKTSPLVARRGSSVIDIESCREFPSKAAVAVTNL